jgi:Uma2 family endonuclease
MPFILDNPAVRQAAHAVSVEDYHRLTEAGIVSKRTELLRGVIVDKMGKSPLHSWLVRLFFDWLSAEVGPGFHVRKEEPLTLADSEPEPDIAVVAGAPDDYRAAHPATAQLVIEVAVSTEPIDRAKAEVYAEAGVEEYWLVLPERQVVEVHTLPSPGGYTRQRTHGRDQTISPGAFPHASLDLSRVFPTDPNVGP